MSLQVAGLKEKSARSMLEGLHLSRRGQAIDAASLSPADVLDTLCEQNLLADAIRFYAQWLKPRELVWWTCLCVRHGIGANFEGDEREALKQAVNWVRQPSAITAAAAEKASKAGGSLTPGYAAARAAALAANAVENASEREVGKMAALAVLRSGGSELHEDFIELARLVGQERYLWDLPGATAQHKEIEKFEDWATGNIADEVVVSNDMVGRSVCFRLGDTDEA